MKYSRARVDTSKGFGLFHFWAAAGSSSGKNWSGLPTNWPKSNPN